MEPRQERKSRIKVIRAVGALAIVAGLILMGWPLYQFVYSHFHQRAAYTEFVTVEDPEPDETAPPADDTVTDRPSPEPEEPEPFRDEGPFLIIIEEIGLSARVLDGIDEATLAKGPGFYPQSAVPGEPGNVSIAGHRNVYGRWFLHLDRLSEGDLIVLKSPHAEYEYRVESLFVVAPDAWEVVDPTEEPKLTLTTCQNGVTQRLIVRARLVGTSRDGF